MTCVVELLPEITTWWKLKHEAGPCPRSRGGGSLAAGARYRSERIKVLSSPESFLAGPSALPHGRPAAVRLVDRRDDWPEGTMAFAYGRASWSSVMPNAIEMLRMEEFGCPPPPTMFPRADRTHCGPPSQAKPGHVRVVGGAVKVPGSLWHGQGSRGGSHPGQATQHPCTARRPQRSFRVRLIDAMEPASGGGCNLAGRDEAGGKKAKAPVAKTPACELHS